MLKVYRMMSGEEIVTEMITRRDGKHLFIRPRALVTMQGPGGEMQAIIVPWMTSDPDGSVIIENGTIVGELEEVPRQLELDYTKNTTGLEIAQAVPAA